MKLLPTLVPLALIIGFSVPANAAKKKTHHALKAHHGAKTHHGAKAHPGAAGKHPVDAHETLEEKSASVTEGETEVDTPPPSKPTPTPMPAVPADSGKPASPGLDFDFFAGSGTAGGAGAENAEDKELAAKADTRRWMLRTHQTLGIATWLALAATVTVGQLNYNQLYGGGGGSNKWQTPHRWLVISSSTLFAATGAFALFAPTPYKKPLHFDTGLVHRIAVIGATLGMVAEGVLGWITTHQADAGNPHNLRTMARYHQIVGYTTLGFLTVAGTVWVF